MKLFRREAEFEHRDAMKEEAAAAVSEARARILEKVMFPQDQREELQNGKTDRKMSKEHRSGRATEDAVYGRR